MGKEVDIAREHNFLNEILTKIQELETDEKVKQQLLTQYKSHAAKEDLQLDKKLLESVLIDLLLNHYKDSNEVIGIRLPDTMKILNVKDLVNLQKQRLAKKLADDNQMAELGSLSEGEETQEQRKTTQLKQELERLEKQRDTALNFVGMPLEEYTEVSDKIDKLNLEIKLRVSHALNQAPNTPTAASDINTTTVSDKSIEEKFSYLANSIFRENENITKRNPIRYHYPTATPLFLRNFKYDNETRLKELVHTPNIEEDYDYSSLKQSLYNIPQLFTVSKKDEIQKFEFINSETREKIRDFVLLFEKYGKLSLDSNKHPFGHNKEYTAIVKTFKKLYRFGYNTDEAKDLLKTIKDTFLKKEYPTSDGIISFNSDGKFIISQLVVLPDERSFNFRSNFFTWVPSIEKALAFIVQGILQHSNIDGNRDFNPNEKQILITLDKERIAIKDNEYTLKTLKICDKDSISMKDAEDVANDICGTNLIEFDLRQVCDFSILADFNGQKKRINLLEYGKKDFSIKDTDEEVRGFTYEFKFYDV